MLLGTLEQSFIFAVMVLGVYISYKILDFPDMTVDGSFPLGAAVAAASIVKGLNPVLALILAMAAGAAAGFITGMIHVKLRVTNLLAGIIVMTGLYSINLRIMGKSNIPLFSVKHLFNGNVSAIVVVGVILLIVKLGIDFLLKTKFGFALKALGDNESLIISLGLNEKTLKIYGLMLANSLVALSGAVLAQYQGFADVGMGTGTIITGLASIIIGDALFGKKKAIKISMMVIFGTIIYRTIIALSLKVGMNASDLKLITSALVVIIIFLKEKKHLLKGGIINA
ncbi:MULTISPECIES: ABC transporter permease [Fusobacterium]|jgi:putative ABC transport system permease protein|uniref:ABC transporter permease n=1 Tax=Fusobacterium varium ATCC 27725 TaxID=469618 RepID=A0ABN5JGZ2_FUSVA|nr:MULTISPECIES: ABC transporter [Fusobacterium]AVQ31315.1 ABC transporter permease [Fusobacterium varium ATCC 27725]EES62637.1 branched-chain amino acid ABC transporter, permease protein [Fusobacterium varium ATCC 27725]MCF0170111.1 ABC transporter permease [Fusobacterium varium]MCF2672536.1 ABC transporter permease [Fusobacterium varium]OFL81870.1 ABC transporter [Fusobacterium sp. HMSC073F01]